MKDILSILKPFGIANSVRNPVEIDKTTSVATPSISPNCPFFHCTFEEIQAKMEEEEAIKNSNMKSALVKRCADKVLKLLETEFDKKFSKGEFAINAKNTK